MEYKLSQVLDEQIESGGNRIPGITLGERDGQEQFSALAFLENTILPVGNRDHPLQSTEWHESDNYQVALVPLRNQVDRGTTSQAPIVRSVLLLPLTWKELMVRLRAEIGISGSGAEHSVVRFGEVCVDFSSMEVTRSEDNVALTTLEFKLLKFLVQNAGRVISRDEMLNEVWGYENYPCTRTVDNHILRLRQKLERDPSSPVHFHTVHGVGYKFVVKASRVVAEHKM